MCIWIISACLGIVVIPNRVYIPLGIPPPILIPTTPSPTTLPPATNPPPSGPPPTNATTAGTTAASTGTNPTRPLVTIPPAATNVSTPPPTTPIVTGPTLQTTPTVIGPTLPTTVVTGPTQTTIPPVIGPTLPTTAVTVPTQSTIPPVTGPTLPTTAVTGPTQSTIPPVTGPTTLPTLTPVTSLPTTGITPPPGVTPTQQPFPNIDPRLPQRFPFQSMDDIEPLVRFGNLDYQDIVVEVDLENDPIRFPGPEELDDVRTRNKRQATNCGCFLPTQCPPNNTDGTGLIDFRIVTGGNNVPQCVNGLRYCCIPGIPTTLPPLTTSRPVTLPTLPPLTTAGPIPQQSCGSRIQTGITYPTQPGQARYGDYPWMVVILTTDNFYVGGGVLIDTQHVLTAAHRIMSYPNGVGLKIRLGEWDAAGNYEQYPYRDFQILRVWTHEAFNPNSLFNDISMIRLVGGVPVGTPGIVPICMPSTNQSFDNQRCWVAGWGKNSFGITGLYQTVLKSVDVPVIPQATCEATFRTTRLGSFFILDRPSFICAGGELNKDACTGDGGSGLVCETTPGRWTLAGLVAWGLGCASQGIPGAYVNVANYVPWITSRQATAG